VRDNRETPAFRKENQGGRGWEELLRSGTDAHVRRGEGGLKKILCGGMKVAAKKKDALSHEREKKEGGARNLEKVDPRVPRKNSKKRDALSKGNI